MSGISALIRGEESRLSPSSYHHVRTVRSLQTEEGPHLTPDSQPPSLWSCERYMCVVTPLPALLLCSSSLCGLNNVVTV